MAQDFPVTAVMVTHFSERVIADSLACLPPGLPIIVVDNASTDGTCEIIRNAAPQARIIRNRVGAGYGNGANQGLAEAKTDFILLINPDARLRQGALENLIAAAERYPEAAVLAPTLRQPDGSWEVSHDVDVFRRLSMPSRRTDPEPDGDICADYVSGATILLRRKALETIGGFESAIFLYYEDDDFCLRLRKAGWVLIRIANAVVDHAGGGSIKRTWDKHWEKFWHLAWSRLFIEKKYRGTVAMLRVALPALFRFGLKAPLYLLMDFRHKGLRDAARFSGTLAFLLGVKAR